MLNILSIKRYEDCVGISFPSIGRWKIEFWYCPAHYEIQPHSHPNEDIELMFLFGHNTRFSRTLPGEFLGQSFLAKFSHIGKIFSIPAGSEHSFTVSCWPLIFMNIEKWKVGVKPTSASEDFKLTVKDTRYATTT